MASDEYPVDVPTSTARFAPITCEHCHERALLGRDLHAGDRSERARLLDEVALDVVGWCPVFDQVAVHIGGEKEGFGFVHAAPRNY